MNTKPILFNSEMVRSILDGRKTQTRREVKARKGWPIDFVGGAGDINDPSCWGFESAEAGEWFFLDPDGWGHKIPCPYGDEGDRLWVRETHSFDKQVDGIKASELSKGEPVYYHADKAVMTTGCSMIEAGKGRPSIFMPRWASRITLEITDVRVERLQDISEVDAKAEGVETKVYGSDPFFCTRDYSRKINKDGFWPGFCSDSDSQFSDSFRTLWKSINGADSWDANPWVWVIGFKVHHCNVDSFAAKEGVVQQ